MKNLTMAVIACLMVIGLVMGYGISNTYADGGYIGQEDIANRVYDSSTNSLRTNGGTTTIDGGVKNSTASGLPVALASSTACKKVLIKAAFNNTGDVYVGGSSVNSTTHTGFPLDAGEVVISTVDNLADIYIVTTVTGDEVNYAYEN